MSSFFEDWHKYMALAYENGKDSQDWKWYIHFLRETRKSFSKLYAELSDDPTRAGTVETLGKFLKLISCELKENNIKYKQGK